MKTLATGLIVIVVLIASLVFLLSSVCTVSPGIGGRERLTIALFALVSLAVILGGIKLIGHLNRPQ